MLNEGNLAVRSTECRLPVCEKITVHSEQAVGSPEMLASYNLKIAIR
jgi:hypothetical protein